MSAPSHRMLAIGLMSGTSLDGVDAALIETDGEGFVRPIAYHETSYTQATRDLIANACALALKYDRPAPDPVIEEATRIVTMLHIGAVLSLLRSEGRAREEVEVIGFHGQTLAHRPDRGWSWQIGNAGLLAQELGIRTVSNFRGADLAAGGQGAPLLPVYHRALSQEQEKPVAILNLGGIANITAIGSQGDLIAFDSGMANALINDWMLAETGEMFDRDGATAASGQVDEAILAAMLDHPFFDAPSPKSLDRDDFNTQPVRGLSTADGAATLTAFSAEAVALGIRQLPERPRQILVSGGGRKNACLMAMIAERCGIQVQPVDSLGWNGDAVEAEGFAYMAVRSIKYLPISFSGTTGVERPTVGGVLHRVGPA